MGRRGIRYEKKLEALERYKQGEGSQESILDMLGDCPVHVIVLCPNVETVKKHEALRGKVGYIGFTPEALYADFMRETPKIGFWLDTTGQSPEQSVKDILLHFRVS